MAQRFRKQLHAGRVSRKYSRRSKRGHRRTEEGCPDTSMVKNKEDFMKTLGLQMKKGEKKKEDDAMVERKNDSSTATLRIRDCSVVIVGETCKICGLMLKCISDVIFHTEMRHGNGFLVCSTMVERQERSNMAVHRRRRNSNSNNNGNQLRLTLKIGNEVISEISMHRKHLKIHASAEETETERRGRNGEESSTLKNDYKSSVVGIDSFVSGRNHCNDYVISVQPLNHTHQCASRNTLLHEGSENRTNDNYLQATRVIEESNSTTIDSLLERLPQWSLHPNDLICNNNYSNNNSHIRAPSIREFNLSDKENESTETQPVENVTDVISPVQAATMNLPQCQTVSDDDDIQEILRITRRRRTDNQANIKRKLDCSLYGDTMLSDSEVEFLDSPKKMRWPTYSIVM